MEADVGAGVNDVGQFKAQAFDVLKHTSPNGIVANANGDISTAASDGGAAWVTDDTTGVAGGYIQVVPAAFAKIVPMDEDRLLVLKITAAGTAAGLFAVDLVYANA